MSDIILTQEQCDLVLGALDTMGVKLADYNHTWSEGERAIYEEACRALGRPPEVTA